MQQKLILNKNEEGTAIILKRMMDSTNEYQNMHFSTH